MNLEDLFIDAIKRGEESQKRQAKCKKEGGHYKDQNTWIGKNPAWKCRCGLIAVKVAKLWK